MYLIILPSTCILLNNLVITKDIKQYLNNLI